MKTRLFFIMIFTFVSASVFAAKVDTVRVFSKSMKKEIPVVIVTPDAYSRQKSYPVSYLLHGYSDSYKGWINGVPEIKTLADEYNMIFVNPDGGFSSWYFDSPVDESSRYETFISGELIAFIDTNYSTKASPKGRAITGLSMGGHGALYLAFRHQDIFGAAGSTSGGVDIRPFPKNWDIEKRLGSYSENPENWEKNTVINMLHLLVPNSLALIIDCGTSDFFYTVNCQLHEKLLERNIPHDFIARPGSHNWDYWRNSIKYQLLFFHNYFEKQK
ncbi:MAG: esterase family protein [Prevotellaceae bacterium]|nr:esterase family protein [Prevotellaceae bacterium]